VALTLRDKDALLDEFALMGSAKTRQQALGDLKQLEKTSTLGDETLRGLESEMAKLKKPDAIWSKGGDAVANPMTSFHQNTDGNGDP
jgi:hypothetical protein